MERELPRLTSALREYGGVSSRLSREVVKFDEAVLRQKRERKKRREGEEGGGSWNTIAENVVAQSGKQNSVKVWSYVYVWCTVTFFFYNDMRYAGRRTTA